MNSSDFDFLVRQHAFGFLSELSSQFGDTLPIQPLRDGFSFEGHRVPLLGPKGIFKPKILGLPLSITTSPNSPYDDTFAEGGLLQYRYRGSDPEHPDNVGLRAVMQARKPLIYFHGIIPGKYVAAWPTYIVGDNPAGLCVTAVVDDKSTIAESAAFSIAEPAAEYRRQYITAEVKVRLHQRLFRERVLNAYKEQCALCRLRHVELLEASHIIPDSEAGGEPRVDNGVALCKLHHAAFDRNILGIRPDYVVEIREDILLEVDGPMLKFGLQQMHGTKIIVPRRGDQKPSKMALESRYEKFLRA